MMRASPPACPGSGAMCRPGWPRPSPPQSGVKLKAPSSPQPPPSPLGGNPGETGLEATEASPLPPSLSTRTLMPRHRHAPAVEEAYASPPDLLLYLKPARRSEEGRPIQRGTSATCRRHWGGSRQAQRWRRWRQHAGPRRRRRLAGDRKAACFALLWPTPASRRLPPNAAAAELMTASLQLCVARQMRGGASESCAEDIGGSYAAYIRKSGRSGGLRVDCIGWITWPGSHGGAWRSIKGAPPRCSPMMISNAVQGRFVLACGCAVDGCVGAAVQREKEEKCACLPLCGICLESDEAYGYLDRFTK